VERLRVCLLVEAHDVELLAVAQLALRDLAQNRRLGDHRF
jgi:hypothetical protein